MNEDEEQIHEKGKDFVYIEKKIRQKVVRKDMKMNGSIKKMPKIGSYSKKRGELTRGARYVTTLSNPILVHSLGWTACHLQSTRLLIKNGIRYSNSFSFTRLVKWRF